MVRQQRYVGKKIDESRKIYNAQMLYMNSLLIAAWWTGLMQLEHCPLRTLYSIASRFYLRH